MANDLETRVQEQFTSAEFHTLVTTLIHAM